MTDTAGVFLQSELERLDPILHEPLAGYTYLRDIPLRQNVTITDEASSFASLGFAAAGGINPTGVSWASRMPRKPLKLPRMTVADMVEELRSAATDPDVNTPGITAEETLEGEVAQTLEEFEAALMRIAEGADRPEQIAQEALSLSSPLKPLAASEDFLWGLLKPRRE